MSRFGNDTPEAVLMYECDGQDRGDLIFNAEEFKQIFGFTPKDDEVYHLALTITDINSEEDLDCPQASTRLPIQ